MTYKDAVRLYFFEEEEEIKFLYLKDGMITEEVIAGFLLFLQDGDLYTCIDVEKPLILENGTKKQYVQEEGEFILMENGHAILSENLAFLIQE